MLLFSRIHLATVDLAFQRFQKDVLVVKLVNRVEAEPVNKVKGRQHQSKGHVNGEGVPAVSRPECGLVHPKQRSLKLHYRV